MSEQLPASPPNGRPWRRPAFDTMVQVLAQGLRSGQPPTDDDRRRAEELLVALSVPSLLQRAAIAETIIRAADSFHPVASFFVAGSPQRDYIVEVLQGAEASGETSVDASGEKRLAP